MSDTISRRQLTGLSIGLGLAAVAGCQSAPTPTPPDPSPRTTSLPAYVPFDGPRPDFAGDASGVPDAYLKYPDPAPEARTAPVGLTKPVSFFVQGTPATVPRASNSWWKQYEHDLGAEMAITAASYGDQYLAKLQTTIAGGSISDLTQYTALPQLGVLLDRVFTDLTPHLGGDAVKKYPALASIPTSAWEVGVVGGKLYGIPQPRIPAGTVLIGQSTVLESIGVPSTPELTSGEDFLDLCKELIDPARKRFALGETPHTWILPHILESLGGVNGWTLGRQGEFISMYETPEFERALEIVATMFKDKLFHPESFTNEASDAWFSAGVTGLYSDSFAAWQLVHAPKGHGVVRMPKWEGGGWAPKHLGPAAYADPVGIKKTDDPARIDEMLRVANYLASPFGTSEYLRVNFGVAGTEYHLKDGVVTRTDRAYDQVIPGIRYAGSQQSRYLYVPEVPELTKVLHSYCATVIPDGVPDRSRGRFSETYLRKGAAGERKLGDVQSDIIQGRASLTSWKQAVADWKTSAGDAIAREYAAS